MLNMDYHDLAELFNGAAYDNSKVDRAMWVIDRITNGCQYC